MFPRSFRQILARATILWTSLLLTLVYGGQWLRADEPPAVAAKLSEDLTEVLTAQSRAWNRADIDAFMQHYWKSERLTFSSGGVTTRGWQATIDRYRRRYATPEQMGRLTFDHLEFTRLGGASALVLGQWHLHRGDEQLGGNFSLVCRHLGGRWVIVHDHTSSLDEPDSQRPSPCGTAAAKAITSDR